MDGLGRMGEEWALLQKATRGAAICAAFGLPFPIDPAGDHFAQSLALVDLGLCEASIIAEPRYRRNLSKAQRDALLERDTIHQAPTWRHADADETGVPAIILPVLLDDGHCRAMSLRRLGDVPFAPAIADLVAIPLDGTRPLSRTGHTLAVGPFNVTGGTLRVYGGGLTWLTKYLDQARAITADTPAHLVTRLHFPLPPPDDIATLLVEPHALEWRNTMARCVIPHAASKVIACDSTKLAQLINSLMHKKERTRPMPVVCGPREAARG